MKVKMKLCWHVIHIILMDLRITGYQNIALRKPAAMSGIHVTWGPHLSNDGDRRNSKVMHGNSCSHTALSESNQVWWQVNLENIYPIKSVKITYRSTFERRLAGFSIFVSNSSDFRHGVECFHYTSQRLPQTVKDWPCSAYGQYVTIYNERNSSVTYPSQYSDRAILELCEVEISGCPYFKYGSTCTQDCFCKNVTCDYTTGVCPGNCRDGYTGTNCDQCSAGRFGKRCEKCGSCKLDMHCDSVTGICPIGCKAGWQVPQCLQECEDGSFGQSCSEICGNCDGGEPCDRKNGSCFNGCAVGYTSETCKSACEPGKFGDGCSRQCGFCKEYTTCDIVTGHCSYGCRAGWQEPECTKSCLNHSYGEGCHKKCGHCKDGETCNRFSGICNQGCDPGFIGAMCDKVCERGKHGLDCNNNCGNCYRDENCHHHNGTCPNGCIQGWEPPLCVTCIPGYYGPDCNNKCGRCTGQESCDQRSGECLNGCQKNWNGSKCNFKILYKNTRFVYIKTLNIPVIAVCVVITVFAIVGCILIVLKQSRTHMNTDMAVTFTDTRSISNFENYNGSNDKIVLMRRQENEYQEMVH